MKSAIKHEHEGRSTRTAVVAVARAADDGSLNAQLRQLREWSERRGVKVIRDFGTVGSSALEGRKQFERLVEFVQEQPRRPTVLVTSLERLTRNATELSRLTALANVEVVESVGHQP